MSDNLRDYIDENRQILIEKIGVIGNDVQFAELYEFFSPIIEVHISMLNLPDIEDITGSTRLDIIPLNLATDIAEQVDIRFPHLPVVTRAIIWMELANNLYNAADMLFVEKMKAKFLSDTGIKEFLDAMEKYRRKN